MLHSAPTKDKTFFEKAWDWLKDVDYEKWFNILKVAAPMLLADQAETFTQRPAEIW
jgi:hypothetical protein